MAHDFIDHSQYHFAILPTKNIYWYKDTLIVSWARDESIDRPLVYAWP